MLAHLRKRAVQLFHSLRAPARAAAGRKRICVGNFVVPVIAAIVFIAASSPAFAQVPIVTGVSANSGGPYQTVTITGLFFAGATAVSFGSTPATSSTVISANSITATVPAPPAGTGTVDVFVTNASGTSAANPPLDQFTYLTPTVTKIMPASGPAGGGTSVTITGTNFAGGNISVATVKFGNLPATSFVVDSATSITAVSPPNTGTSTTVDVTVITSDGTSATSAADQFTYSGTVPTVTGVSPNTGPTGGGTTVIVTGTNLAGATAVNFGSTPATSFSVTTVPSGTVITATSPSGTGTVDVTVVTPGGTSATSLADQFVYNNGPTVTNVSPPSGPVTGNTSVIITGTNFSGATAVEFGRTPAVSFTVNGATSITATSPAGTGTVNVTVTTPSGTSATSSADQFSYTSAPAVTAVSPNAGPPSGGSSVTITGSNFTGATAVSFGGTPATSFTVVSATSITATSPGGAGTVDVTVTTPGGTSVTSAADHFLYTNTPLPTVTGLSPNNGPASGGTSVTITGTNFTGATAVSFGSTPASSFTVNGATSITATSPPGSGTVGVTVTTPGGTSVAGAASLFAYAAGGPTVTAVTPNTGSPAGGTTVTITGTNFTGATGVSFGGKPAPSFTVNGPTSITATSPAGSGTVDVTVTTPGGVSGTSSADHFFYSKATTTLTLTSSPNPSTVGQLVTFTAKVTGNSPTGTVTFSDGSTQLGSATLSGGIATLAVLSLTLGTHTITASYGGDANNSPDPVSLTQIVGPPPGSVNLRAMQISTMPIVAQMAGQAITGAIDSAIAVGLSGNPLPATLNGSGFTYYFDADPQAPRRTAMSDQGLGADALDGDFKALGYAPRSGPQPPPPPPPPIPPPPLPRDWLAWVDMRGMDFDRTTFGDDLKGLQANATIGLTHRLTPDILIGVLAGYEYFDFSSNALDGVLTGNGFTAGTYAAWRFAPTLRFDAAGAWTDILAAGTAEGASGNFNAYRWLASGGLTGTYSWYGFVFEPSARAYALWEQETAYTDSLGTPQAGRDFDTGRASGGMKVTYRFTAGTVNLTPYVGLYGDYYFTADNGTIFGLTTAVPAIQGWAARTTAGVAVAFAGGSQFAIGAEYSGIGSDTSFWTLSVRGSVPF